MDPNDREEGFFSNFGNDIPTSHAISRELLLPQLQLWHFHCLACIQYVDVRDHKLSRTSNSASDVRRGR